MINICFFVEGPTEERFFSSDIFKAIVLSKNPKINLNDTEQYNINVINYSGTPKKGIFKRDVISFSKFVDIIIPVFDVYANPFNIKQDVSNKEKNYNEFHEYFESIVNANCKARIISYMSFQEIETLLFSDVNMLNAQIMKCSSRNKTIKNINWTDIEKEIKNPSAIIECALCNSYYNKPVFFKETIETIKISTILDRCEYFNKMISKLISSIEEIQKLINEPKKGSSVRKAEGCGLYLKQVQY